MSGLITRDESTVLKGIAILMVIIQHIGQAFNIGLVNPLGAIGVFLFLFLSGYGLSCSFCRNGRASYFKRKFFKVYIPYVAAVIIFLIWNVIMGNDNEISTIFKFFVLLKLPQGSYWFLILLFYWYIIFYALTYIFDNAKALIINMTVASVAIVLLVGFNRGYVWQFASFPLGVLCAKYQYVWDKIFMPAKRNFVWGGVLLSVIILSILKKLPYVEANELGPVDTLLQISITYAMGYLCLSLRRKFLLVKPSGEYGKWFSSLILMIGTISYELYLSHVIALDYLKGNPKAISLMIWMLVTVLGTCILYGLNKYVIKPLLDRGRSTEN